MSFLSFPNWLQKLRSDLAPRRGPRLYGRRGSLRAASHRLSREALSSSFPSFLFS
jgi:hypothetical protein